MTDRFDCRCPVPLASPNPRSRDSCNRCLGYINPDWTSNDRTVGRFYDSLANSCFPRRRGDLKLMVPDEYRVFQIDAEARERAGREHFGNRHLGRNNLVDAREEAGDGANYYFFDHLQRTREHGRNDEYALTLLGAKAFYIAYKTTHVIRAKRGGSPG